MDPIDKFGQGGMEDSMDIVSEPTLYPIYDLGQSESQKEQEAAIEEELRSSLRKGPTLQIKEASSPKFDYKPSPNDVSVDNESPIAIEVKEQLKNPESPQKEEGSAPVADLSSVQEEHDEQND